MFTVCSCLAIREYDSTDIETIFAAADVTITDCSFQNSESSYGGCLALGTLNSLLLTASSFDGCTGLSLHAFAAGSAARIVMRLVRLLTADFVCHDQCFSCTGWQRAHGLVWSASRLSPPVRLLSDLLDDDAQPRVDSMGSGVGLAVGSSSTPLEFSSPLRI